MNMNSMIACNGDEDKFNCKNSSKCIIKSDVCDGEDDCGNASDENFEICASKLSKLAQFYIFD